MRRRQVLGGLAGSVVGMAAISQADSPTTPLTKAVKAPRVRSLEERWLDLNAQRALALDKDIDYADNPWSGTFLQISSEEQIIDLKARLVQRGLPFSEHTIQGCRVLCHKKAAWVVWEDVRRLPLPALEAVTA